MEEQSIELIEDTLKDLILQDVDFRLDGKSIRKGKIKILNTKQFFVRFKIENDGNTREFELPFPFKIEKIDNGYLFNYALSAFCPRTEEIYWVMKAMDKSQASKLHDSHLEVLTS